MDDAAAARQRERLHVVVFPWLAFGHLIPFLELAKRLAARGHAAVTYVSTPRNVSRLAPDVPPELSATLRLVALPLPRVAGLPEGAESTTDVPHDKVELLRAAFDGLAAPFAAFLADACAAGAEDAAGFDRKADWIVVDFPHHWVPPIAHKYEIPCAIFLSFSASMLAFHGEKSRAANAAGDKKHLGKKVEHLMAPAPRTSGYLPSDLAYRRHEAKYVASAFQPDDSGVSAAERTNQLHRRCPLSFYRSCPEAEGPPCQLLADIYGPRFLPTGLLAPTAGSNGGGEAAADLMRWLDAQPERSVLYAALGTEAPVTTDNVRELARGLELSGQRFLWALRVRGTGGDDAAATPPAARDGLLPDGFERRVAGRGVVCAGWVPQLRVLAHTAVGAFLTHCGWGSTVESLQFGHPLVMLPFVGDQGIVAQAMAAKGVGAEVARNYDDASFRGEDVAAAVRRVMVGEEGKVFDRKAKELRAAVLDEERQGHYIDVIAEHLRGYKYGGGD
ncbi:putative UDP-rhamnose:rhamnosyltransferase 1 isoform X2 [Oryza brachyantha]|uniref:putative UDP-rhamnose:rhamnosyltransferase 1 isoform X2 n=1 Tax=Oryza brachyantha TaxID=4533 RepID=UPI001AD97A4C|nr:putative UDP-rhamnose:rhamnosyltransferase 1 isoform X2 [Oryza brachyantha]